MAPHWCENRYSRSLHCGATGCSTRLGLRRCEECTSREILRPSSKCVQRGGSPGGLKRPPWGGVPGDPRGVRVDAQGATGGPLETKLRFQNSENSSFTMGIWKFPTSYVLLARKKQTLKTHDATNSGRAPNREPALSLQRECDFSRTPTWAQRDESILWT